MSVSKYTVAILLLGVAATSSANVNLTSPPVTDWGIWGKFERCPNGRYAQGFQLKTEPNQWLGDDTAANSVKLFCGDPYNPATAILKSTEGEFGDWGNIYSCFPGFLNGFQLRVEPNLNSGDDTATNNIRMFCTNLPNPNDYIEGDGLSYGTWGEVKHCFSNQAICGLQTQVEPNQGDGDDTSLNNIKVECCDYTGKVPLNSTAPEMYAHLLKVNPKLKAVLDRLSVNPVEN